jgi:protein ImuB
MCVWFPRWPIQRIRLEKPELSRRELALFSIKNNRPAIIACDPRAERAGVRIGQPLAEARALLPDAHFLASDQESDREGLVKLAIDGQKFSPSVGLEEVEQPQSLLCETTGCTHLWGGEEPFLKAVHDYWKSRGYQFQLALAGSVGSAWALAHARRYSLVSPGDDESAVRHLPAVLLRLPEETLQQLQVLGLYTIGDVLTLPRESLSARFGLELTTRLDQLLGRRPESFSCERLLEPPSVFREWESPIEDRNTLGMVCKQMLTVLIALAERHGMGVHELSGSMRIATESEPRKFVIRLVEPTRDLSHLGQLVDLHLERSTWSGGVLAVSWSALRLGSIEQTQRNWLGDESTLADIRERNNLVDRLASRLGAEAVLKVCMLPDPQPEKGYQLVPWTDSAAAKALEFTLPAELSRARPLRLLANPQRISVTSTVPGGQPAHVLNDRKEFLVNRAWGPERIATGWWRERDIERDYYRVEAEDGTQAWVFRDLVDGNWFLHGYFD